MNINYEREYIAAVVFDQAVLDDHPLPSSLFADSISRELHGKMVALNESGEGIDLVTICDGDYQKFKHIDFVMEAVTAANAGYYAKKIREAGLKRKLLTVAHQLGDMALIGSGEDALDFIEREISLLDVDSGGPKHIREAMRDAFIDFEESSLNPGEVRGLKCGLRGLDKILGGLQPGKLYVVGARPGMGKSALLLRFAEEVSVVRDNSSLIFSLEMPAFEWAQRALCSIGRVDGGAARIGKLTKTDFDSLQDTANKLMQSGLFIDESPTMTIQKLKQIARAHARKHKLKMLGVDYLQLLQGKGDSRQQQIGDISRGLKQIAKELNIPVVALSQLNRSLESRTDKRPMMSDLREAGDIEQDADCVIFVYRGHVYGEQGKMPEDAEINVAKQRGGPIGKIDAQWTAKFTRFDGIDK